MTIFSRFTCIGWRWEKIKRFVCMDCWLESSRCTTIDCFSQIFNCCATSKNQLPWKSIDVFFVRFFDPGNYWASISRLKRFKIIKNFLWWSFEDILTPFKTPCSIKIITPVFDRITSWFACKRYCRWGWTKCCSSKRFLEALSEWLSDWIFRATEHILCCKERQRRLVFS